MRFVWLLSLALSPHDVVGGAVYSQRRRSLFINIARIVSPMYMHNQYFTVDFTCARAGHWLRGEWRHRFVAAFAFRASRGELASCILMVKPLSEAG